MCCGRSDQIPRPGGSGCRRHQRFLGADDPQTLTARHDLASAYWWSGRLAEATALNERTLIDRERVLGSDHPDTLTSLSNLAGSHDKAGRPGVGRAA